MSAPPDPAEPLARAAFPLVPLGPFSLAGLEDALSSLDEADDFLLVETKLWPSFVPSFSGEESLLLNRESRAGVSAVGEWCVEERSAPRLWWLLLGSRASLLLLTVLADEDNVAC